MRFITIWTACFVGFCTLSIIKSEDSVKKINEVSSQDEATSKKTVKQDLVTKNNVLQLKNDQLEKSLEQLNMSIENIMKQLSQKKETESMQSLIIKELEESTRKETKEEGELQRLQRLNKKLKKENDRLRQIRQNDDPKAKNRSAIDFPGLDRENPFPGLSGGLPIPFSVNVRGNNEIFQEDATNLDDFKGGFSRDGSMWLGLDRLHELTSTGNWDLLVSFKWAEIGGYCNAIGIEVDPKSGTFGWGRWPNFTVDGAGNNYKWHFGALKHSVNFRNCDILNESDAVNGAPFRLDDAGNVGVTSKCGSFWFLTGNNGNLYATAAVPWLLDRCSSVFGTSYTGIQVVLALIMVD